MQGKRLGRAIEGEVWGWTERHLACRVPIVGRRNRCLRTTARQVGLVVAVIGGIVAVQAFGTPVIGPNVVVAVAVMRGIRFSKCAGRF